MDSREPQEKKYVLRKPILATRKKDSGMYRFTYQSEDDANYDEDYVDESWFENIFVEFDEDTTRKQIADIITFYRTLVNGWAETGAGADDLPETALEESIDAILDITLGRKQ